MPFQDNGLEELLRTWAEWSARCWDVPGSPPDWEEIFRSMTSLELWHKLREVHASSFAYYAQLVLLSLDEFNIKCITGFIQYYLGTLPT